MKILIIFGTRPEAIKLFPIIHGLQADERFCPIVCVSGQHREMLDQVLKIAEITPQFDLNLMRSDQTLNGLTATLLSKLGAVIDCVKPSRVIVQGDTATAMAGALSAYYRQIPVDHVEAGLRSGNIYHPWPEEVNRKIIGAIASLHFAPTEFARSSLLAENIDPGRVHVTGNTVIDALYWVMDRISVDPTLVSGLAELEERFSGKRIIGVTSHRRENLGEGILNIAQAVRKIAERPDVAVIFPVHLNPNVRSVINRELSGISNVALIEPLDYPHFVRLLTIADIILTDSGGVQEEAPALGKPVLVMREMTERPEGITAGTAKLVGTDVARIVAETFKLLDIKEAFDAMSFAHNPFGDGQSARRIIKFIGNEIAQ